jgi:hypothetical protein
VKPIGFTVDDVCISCRVRDGKPHEKKVIKLVDNHQESIISIHNNSYENNYRALVERIVYHKGSRPIESKEKVWSLKADTEIRKFETIIPGISSREFVEHYAGRKRKIYERAARSLVERPLEHRDSWIKAFVKDEKFDRVEKPDQVPRLIQPRTPRYNVELGKLIQPMEKPIYDEIDELYGFEVVMKGKNAEERATALRRHWEFFADPVAIGIDASRFDQHTRGAALNYEHKVYLRHTPKASRARLRRILKEQRRTHGVCYTRTGNIKYKATGRCSGDINTSMGNIIIMTHLNYDYLESLDVPYRFINDGDDGVILIERKHLDKLEGLQAWFENYGYKMQTEEVVDVFERIEFCQCQPVWDGSRWLMCRKPDVVIKRDVYTTKPAETKGQWDYYRGAIGNCGIAGCGGIPVLDAFYSMMARGAKNVRSQDTNTGLYWMAIGMDRVSGEPSTDSRVSFFKAFDITPDLQVALEARFRNHHPVYSGPTQIQQYLN